MLSKRPVSGKEIGNHNSECTVVGTPVEDGRKPDFEVYRGVHACGRTPGNQTLECTVVCTPVEEHQGTRLWSVS